MCQLSKALLKSEMFQLLYHLCGPALALLQYVHVSPVLQSSALTTDIKVCCRGVFLEQAQHWAVNFIPQIRRQDMSLLFQLLPSCCVNLGVLVYLHYPSQIYSICSACACECLCGSDLV